MAGQRNILKLVCCTAYFIFARSKENASYNAGAASAGLQVKTDAAQGGKSAGANVDTPSRERRIFYHEPH